jgi:hypothetical protein
MLDGISTSQEILAGIPRSVSTRFENENHESFGILVHP